MPSTLTYCHNPYAPLPGNKRDECAADEMHWPENSGVSDSEDGGEFGHPTPREMDAAEDCGMMIPQTSSKFYETYLGDNLPFFEYGFVPRKAPGRAVLDTLPRLFVGQLPYNITAEMVAALLQLVTGCTPVHVEKIIRWKQNKRSCGCFHVYVRPEDTGAFLAVDQTALCEADGFWVATTEEQREFLRGHCEYLTNHREARQPKMPYQMMTVQVAKSDYRRSRDAAVACQDNKAAIPPQQSVNAGGGRDLEAIPFFPYEEAASANHCAVQGTVMLFVGQVPHMMTPGQLVWLLRKLLPHRAPGEVERAQHIGGAGNRPRPCCFHVYVTPEAADELLKLSNSGVLCAMRGAYIAKTDAHRQILSRYRYDAKSNHDERQSKGQRGTPQYLMTIEKAAPLLSTRRCNTPLNACRVPTTSTGAAGQPITAPSTGPPALLPETVALDAPSFHEVIREPQLAPCGGATLYPTSRALCFSDTHRQRNHKTNSEDALRIGSPSTDTSVTSSTAAGRMTHSRTTKICGTTRCSMITKLNKQLLFTTTITTSILTTTTTTTTSILTTTTSTLTFAEPLSMRELARYLSTAGAGVIKRAGFQCVFDIGVYYWPLLNVTLMQLHSLWTPGCLGNMTRSDRMIILVCHTKLRMDSIEHRLLCVTLRSALQNVRRQCAMLQWNGMHRVE
jgi:hypothetical protein